MSPRELGDVAFEAGDEHVGIGHDRRVAHEHVKDVEEKLAEAERAVRDADAVTRARTA